MYKKKDLYNLMKKNIEDTNPSKNVLDGAKFFMQKNLNGKEKYFSDTKNKSNRNVFNKVTFKRKNLNILFYSHINTFVLNKNILLPAKEKMREIKSAQKTVNYKPAKRKWVYALAPLLVIIVVSVILLPQVFKNGTDILPPNDIEGENRYKLDFSHMYISQSNDYLEPQLNLKALSEKAQDENFAIQYRSYYNKNNNELLFTSSKIDMLYNDYIYEIIMSACYYDDQYQIGTHYNFIKNLAKTRKVFYDIEYQGAIFEEEIDIIYDNDVEQGENCTRLYFNLFAVDYLITVSSSISAPNISFDFVAKELVRYFYQDLIDNGILN